MEYLIGNIGTRQLYFHDQLWYCIRENCEKKTTYWKCINTACKASISMEGLLITNVDLPSHYHEGISFDDFKILSIKIHILFIYVLLRLTVQ